MDKRSMQVPTHVLYHRWMRVAAMAFCRLRRLRTVRVTSQRLARVYRVVYRIQVRWIFSAQAFCTREERVVATQSPIAFQATTVASRH